MRETIRRYSDSDPRIQAVRLDENRGIAAATNAALAMARGDFTALLDHDDLLAPEALTWLADTLRQHPQARLMYSDSDRIDSRGERAEPYFKPDWNYDLLLCHNYFNHLTAYHTGLLRDIGGLRDGFEGSQDYDLALRAVERVGPGQIVHIPRLLYHWRRHDKSLTATRLREAAAGARRAVAAHLERSGTPAQVRANPLALVYQRPVA